MSQKENFSGRISDYFTFQFSIFAFGARNWQFRVMQWDSGKHCPPLPSGSRAWPFLIDCCRPQHWDLALTWVPLALFTSQELHTCQKFKFGDTLQYDARCLWCERAMAEDVTQCPQRARVPSSAAEVHEEIICLDVWHPENNSDDHACSDVYNSAPPCRGCLDVWNDSLTMGVCCFVLLTREWERLETSSAVALESSPELSAFTTSLAPPLHPSVHAVAASVAASSCDWMSLAPPGHPSVYAVAASVAASSCDWIDKACWGALGDNTT